jgi:ubiquinone/menaquinone biosynthesis C-methylase UbiE
LPEWLPISEETRLDADPGCQPDIVADMRSLGDIGTFDAVFCSHALEHLTLQDGDIALGEFRRVLRDGGAAIIIVPDLEDVKPTPDVVYDSPSGPVTGHDMYYGFHCGQENELMRHKSGYVQATLKKKLEDNGFRQVTVVRMAGFNLVATAAR